MGRLNPAPGETAKKIDAIKYIRSFTKCSLTEAKMYYEECEYGGRTVKLIGDPRSRLYTVRGLKECGLEVY